MTAVQELTVREAARRVRRSPETIRRWIWSGRLPAIKRGNAYYVDVVRLDALVVELGGQPWHAASDNGPDLAQWLDELTQWKAGNAAGAARTASELVTEDRHARR